MDSDDYSWIKRRLQRLSELFHAVRILDVSELFRSWDLPTDNRTAIMGRFVPAIPVTRPELDTRGLWDIHRYTVPYVRWHILVDKFGSDAEYVVRRFFNARHMNMFDEWFSFKDEYNTETKIHQAIKAEFSDEGRRQHFEICLCQLLNDILLIPDRDHADCYHVRAIPTIEHYELWDWPGWISRPSPSWIELSDDQKLGVTQISDYYRSVQKPQWSEKGLRRLRILKDITNMALSIDFTELALLREIQQTGFVPLRIERIPRESNQQFDSIHSFDYLSDCVTSTPNLPTVRGWWEKEPAKVSDFWRTEFGRWDNPWRTYDPWIASSIVERNLWSRSIWVTFLLQDLTAVAEHLRFEVTREDRMIDPLSTHFYRLPFTFEFLSEDVRLICHLKKLAQESRRV
jgi:4-alpha-glucanotransferase